MYTIFVHNGFYNIDIPKILILLKFNFLNKKQMLGWKIIIYDFYWNNILLKLIIYHSIECVPLDYMIFFLKRLYDF